MHSRFWAESLKEREYFEYLGPRLEVYVRMAFRETRWEVSDWLHLT
jgi:hypothetical protein